MIHTSANACVSGLNPSPNPNPIPDCRWITSTRYYRALVQQNLFGQWELVRFWGGRGNRLGGYLVQPANNRDEALVWMFKEAKRRHKRGYTSATADVK
jgi:predicted DNA-binding WGR domain protein